MPYLFVLVFAETMVLVICASIPALGPIFYIFKGKFSSYRGRSTEDGGGDVSGVGNNQDATLVTFGGSSWKNGSKPRRGRPDGTKMNLSPVGSLDEIPLARVESASVHGEQSETGSSGGEVIRNITEISVNSEADDLEKRQQTTER
jgi:hypothetical protein